MDVQAGAKYMGKLLHASNGAWAVKDHKNDPNRFAAVAASLAYAVGGDNLEYLDSAVDGEGYSVEVFAIGKSLAYHLIKFEGDEPLVNVLPLKSLTSVQVQSTPVVRGADLSDATAKPFVFVASFGDEDITVPTQEGNELQSEVRYGIYGLLTTALSKD
jgi:hypothetical protein